MRLSGGPDRLFGSARRGQITNACHERVPQARRRRRAVEVGERLRGRGRGR